MLQPRAPPIYVAVRLCISSTTALRDPTTHVSYETAAVSNISVLCLSGLDPTGGAGLQADIEACAANGVHALGLVTALTVQDSRNVSEVHAVPATLLERQLDTLLADCRPAAIKIGLIGAPEQIPLLCRTLAQLRLPVVCDPILRAGGGAELMPPATATRLLSELLPLITLLTPNTAEARRLAPQATSLDGCAQTLLATGCAQVLITGGDEPGEEVVNTLYRPDHSPRSWHWPRLNGPFHGAGCTLAAAIAARLALGDAIDVALTAAQEYTQQTLRSARRIGQGRLVPRRR